VIPSLVLMALFLPGRPNEMFESGVRCSVRRTREPEGT